MMLELLARASIEGALLAAGVWIVIRAVPRLSPAVRALLWWCVAAKFIVSLLGLAPITLPVLPAASEPAAVEARSATVDAARTPAAVSAAATRAVPTPVTAPGAATVPWAAVLLSVWGLGLAASLLRTMRGWRETRAVVSRSMPASAELQQLANGLSTLLGVRRPAAVRLSTDIESPLITGVRHPVILVPADRFPTLSLDQQRMALCHELAHMQRGDLWFGCVPAVVERVFFFHPLARLAAREYAFWREAACDEAVLVTLGISPQCYGRLLLALGVSRQSATFSAAGAAWSFSNLKRRITMLGRPSSPSLRSRVLATGAVALAVLAIVPVKAVARSASSPAPAFTVQDVPPVQERVPPVRERVAPVQERAAREQERASRAQERVARVQERVAPEQGRRRSDDLQFVYFSGDRNTMSGSSSDVSRARRYRRSGESLLWFRRDGQEYIVRDPDILREVEELWEPVGRVGEEQGRIGARQGAIGMEQGRHGARLGEIGARQGLVGAQQGVVAARLGVLAAREAMGLSASERREIDRERLTLDRELRELDRQMEALGREMRQVDPPTRDMGDDMSALGRQMDALGRKMEEASRRANSGMRELMDRAIRSRAAEPVR